MDNPVKREHSFGMKYLFITLFLVSITPFAMADDDCPDGMESYCDYQEAKEAAEAESWERAERAAAEQREYELIEIERERNQIMRERLEAEKLQDVLRDWPINSRR